ncbi:Putative membrane protein like [Madurella fahalii]|uniref:Membrane protein like n=1 Tax=Madurella fahalii TaxID=1157608 RepID=A0ABQ0GPE4_9PEZI
MKDNSELAGLEARRTPPHLQLDAVKTPQLAKAAALTAPLAITPSRSTMDAKPESSKAAKWNTKNLALRLGADAISAASAAVLVAPLISIIDRSIMENASGRRTLAASLKSSLTTLLLRPHRVVLARPFALIFSVYGGTYLTANTLDTALSTARDLPATHVSSGTPKFAAPSLANIGLGIYKDQVFVRLFGPSGMTPRPVTLPSYLLFAVRDCMTIFASFNVPHLLGPALSRRLGDEVQRHVSGQTIAQFAAPAAVQFVSTPVHLLGLDMYNRPRVAGGWRDRWAAVSKNWAVSTAARICRIVPAFGVGGVVNVKVRRSLMERLE